jgi:hypothetical protein
MGGKRSISFSEKKPRRAGASRNGEVFNGPISDPTPARVKRAAAAGMGGTKSTTKDCIVSEATLFEDGARHYHLL